MKIIRRITENGKPSERMGRKVSGLRLKARVAGLPKWPFNQGAQTLGLYIFQ